MDNRSSAVLYFLQVSVVTFKLYHVEAFVQLVEKDIQLAAQVDHLLPDELGNIDLDKFQERFGAGKAQEVPKLRGVE